MTSALTDHRALHLLKQELSPHEVLYAESRARGATPVAAARSAGYEDPIAACSDLEASDRVTAVRDIILRDEVRARKLTREDIVDGFQQAASMATTATEMVAAYKELGKLIGAYEPERQVVEHKHSVEAIQQQSDQELMELAGMDDPLEAEYEVLSPNHADSGSDA